MLAAGLAGWLAGWLMAAGLEDDEEEGSQGILTLSSLEELSGLMG